MATVRCAWILTLSACAGGPGHACATSLLRSLGVAALVAGVLMIIAGLGRVAVLPGAPVTNMYESVIFVGLGIGLLGLVLEWQCPGRLVIGVAAGCAALTLILADAFPGTFDPSIRPLQPALRSNFWLVVHVLTVTLSYSAYALVLGIGNITLGYYCARAGNSRRGGDAWQAELLVLEDRDRAAVGGDRDRWHLGRLQLGALWGWDPKEVWALITLLGYLALLHARHVDWVGQFGLAALSVICFSLVVIAWYGVNFVLGSGLHSYGKGNGGEGYVIGALFVQFSFVALAVVQSADRPAAQRE